MKKKQWTLSILVISLLALSGMANASAIYNNLYSANAGVDPLTNWGPPLFDSFSTGPSGFNLADVKLLLEGAPTSPGSFTAAVYSDSSTAPGALLYTIGTLSDSALSSSLSVVDFTLASPDYLAANTRYWLVLNTTNNSSAEWGWSFDQSALGVAGEYFGHGTSVYPNTASGPYQMELSSSSAVPEPTTMLLLGLGLIGVAGVRRKFQK
jgi:hypothetical protein